MIDIGDVRIEPCARRIRVVVAGEAIADTSKAVYLFERGRLPMYYIPIDDVRADVLQPSVTTSTCPRKGGASYFAVVVGGDPTPDRRIDMVWQYTSPTAECPWLAGYVGFDWNSADAWFEEDDEVFKHARDPYHRVDTLRSSRAVEVSIDGVVVASSARPSLVFETGMPTRYYLPKIDVRLDLLVPSTTHSVCPYKGTASYYSVQLPKGGRLVTDVVWYYPSPIPECPKIENLLCFFNEKVDITVDGVLQQRPITPWS